MIFAQTKTKERERKKKKKTQNPTQREKPLIRGKPAFKDPYKTQF